jgi:hypothetical protein
MVLLTVAMATSRVVDTLTGSPVLVVVLAHTVGQAWV